MTHKLLTVPRDLAARLSFERASMGRLAAFLSCPGETTLSLYDQGIAACRLGATPGGVVLSRAAAGLLAELLHHYAETGTLEGLALGVAVGTDETVRLPAAVAAGDRPNMRGFSGPRIVADLTKQKESKHET